MVIRLHLDEHLPHAVAIGLQSRGVDVTTSSSAGLIGSSDEEQLAYCRMHQRVLVTHDDDFLRLHSAGLPHAGIAYCHQGAKSIGELVRTLLLLTSVLDSDDMQNQIEFL